MGAYLKENKKPDMAKLGPVIKKSAPNALVLAYCWSTLSQINDEFNAAGIISNLVLQEDRMAITGKK